MHLIQVIAKSSLLKNKKIPDAHLASLLRIYSENSCASVLFKSGNNRYAYCLPVGCAIRHKNINDKTKQKIANKKL